MKDMNTDIKQILRSRGLKATKQRMIIFEILKNSTEHPSAEMITKQLKKRGETMSLATVYNVIDTLEKHKLIMRVASCDDCMRFDANTKFHVHYKNTATGEVIDYFDDEFSEYVENYIRNNLSQFGEIQNIDLSVTVTPSEIP